MTNPTDFAAIKAADERSIELQLGWIKDRNTRWTSKEVVPETREQAIKELEMAESHRHALVGMVEEAKERMLLANIEPRERCKRCGCDWAGWVSSTACSECEGYERISDKLERRTVLLREAESLKMLPYHLAERIRAELGEGK